MNWGKKSVPFKAEKDIPSLEGKVVLVTGGNIGLGKQCILEYAKHGPAQLWLAARNVDKADAAVREIQAQLPSPARIKVLQMDLASTESVEKAARTFSAESDRLDILMLNAGIMASPAGLTKDGYELQFGTNYVGHALLAKLLLPVLERTAGAAGADVRVVALSSTGHNFTPKPAGIRFDLLKEPADELGAFTRYGQSKLAAILWARKMAKLHPNLTVTSVHPGVVRTNLINGATGTNPVLLALGKLFGNFATSVEQGARNQLWATVAKDGLASGEYYEPVGVGGAASQFGKDDKLADKLWEWTEKELERWNGAFGSGA